MAFLEITPAGSAAAISRIELVSLTGEKLSGEFITTDFETISPSESGQTFNSVAITSVVPVPSGTPFMIAIPAGIHLADLRVLIQDAEGKVMQTSLTTSFTTSAGRQYSFDIQCQTAAPSGTVEIDGSFDEWDTVPFAAYSIPDGDVRYKALRKMKLTSDDRFVYCYLEIEEPGFAFSMPCDFFVDSDGDCKTGGKLTSTDETETKLPYTDSGLEWYIEGGLHSSSSYCNFPASFSAFEYTGKDGDGIFSSLVNHYGDYGNDVLTGKGQIDSYGTGRVEFKMARGYFDLTGQKMNFGVKIMDGANHWAAYGLLPQGNACAGYAGAVDMGIVSLPEFKEERAGFEDDRWFRMRGLVFSSSDAGWNGSYFDRSAFDYIKYAKEHHINCFSVYGPPFGTKMWEDFKKECYEAGIDIEYEEHMISALLPRNLFATHPEYFRVDENGNRSADYNGCPSCQAALDVIKLNAQRIATQYKSTNNKYYCWMDDGSKFCNCPLCKGAGYNAADQALIFEKAILEGLRKINPEATLAHLAYDRTQAAPSRVQPCEGIFLEFAPIYRNFDYSLGTSWARGDDNRTQAQVLQDLEDNLRVFPSETAQVLEYWVDCSRVSWYRPDALRRIPWDYNGVFLPDLEIYASYGIHCMTCYSAYVGPDYVRQFGYPTCLDDYADGLYKFTK